MLTIVNSGQSTIESNFWDSDCARRGLFYLSWNACAAHLLVPDNQQNELCEMRGASMVLLSQGISPIGGDCEMQELKFENDSHTAYCLRLGTRQTNRQRPSIAQGGYFNLAVWTRGGLEVRLPAKFRRVRFIPCLATRSGH